MGEQEIIMEYRQTKMALVAQGLTRWWWLGIITCGVVIFIDIMRWQRAKLTIHKKSVTIEGGILNVSTQDMPFNKIQSVTVVQSALGQILGYGHLQISSGNALQPIVFKYLENPKIVRQVIQDKIEE